MENSYCKKLGRTPGESQDPLRPHRVSEFGRICLGRWNCTFASNLPASAAWALAFARDSVELSFRGVFGSAVMSQMVVFR